MKNHTTDKYINVSKTALFFAKALRQVPQYVVNTVHRYRLMSNATGCVRAATTGNVLTALPARAGKQYEAGHCPDEFRALLAQYYKYYRVKAISGSIRAGMAEKLDVCIEPDPEPYIRTYQDPYGEKNTDVNKRFPFYN